MHLERLFLYGDSSPDTREWSFAAASGVLRKWILLPPIKENAEVFACVALACCGEKDAAELQKRYRLDRLLPAGQGRTLEFIQVRHAPQERGAAQPARNHGGWTLGRDGIQPLPRRKARRLEPGMRYRAAPRRQSAKGWLVIGFGSTIRAHKGTDSFLHKDPHPRLRRCAPLFDRHAKLTDPVAFLEVLHYRGVYCKRGRSREYLRALNRELGPLLGLDADAWLNPRVDFPRLWSALPPAAKAAATLTLDIARHVLDASPGLYDPLTQPGVLLFDGFAKHLSGKVLPPALELIDRLFPNLQVLARLGPKQRTRVPAKLLSRTLSIPRTAPPARQAPLLLRPGTDLLVAVDGKLPNLALMKWSRFLKDQGQKVALARPGVSADPPSAVYASCLFSSPGSLARVRELEAQYGDRLQLGGSGVDLQKRLPPEVEGLDPDYSLYPELGNRAIGFLTRGCPRHCKFCVVPQKEGKPRLDTELDRLLQGRRKLILLDDNLLAHPLAPQLLEEMVQRDLQVNFNQTLDLRLLTPETAELLRRIQGANVMFTRRVLHFSLNDNRGLESLRRRFRLLRTSSRDHIEFVCMYGFNTTLAEDVERFQFLRTLPGAYVFVQRYMPAPGMREPNLSRFFDDRADEHLDALVKVIFPQNMKSMEVYYRWVCRQYAAQRGRIHRGLVETLFRYNSRHLMPSFLERLDALAKGAAIA